MENSTNYGYLEKEGYTNETVLNAVDNMLFGNNAEELKETLFIYALNTNNAEISDGDKCNMLHLYNFLTSLNFPKNGTK